MVDLMSEEKTIPQKPVLEVLCSIQGALGEDNQKVFAKASMAQGREWGKSVPTAQSPEELMTKIADYLENELKIAKNITFEKKDQEYILSFRGCYICHGKLVKERFGITPACAISMFPVGALTSNLKAHNVRLKEIRKPGPIGDCDMAYEIKP
jgi:predicted ArsR family transcriptional regulator